MEPARSFSATRSHTSGWSPGLPGVEPFEHEPAGAQALAVAAHAVTFDERAGSLAGRRGTCTAR